MIFLESECASHSAATRIDQLEIQAGFLQQLASAMTRWSTRWVPDAWIIAVILTVLAWFLAFFLSPGAKPAGFPELPAALSLDKAAILMVYWGRGFWALLTFAMQMALIIVTGYIVAVSPPFRRLLNFLAGIPKSPRGSIALMAFVSMALSFLNWGLSIVGSAVFARYMVKKQRGVDYRLLIAAAYEREKDQRHLADASAAEAQALRGRRVFTGTPSSLIMGISLGLPVLCG